METLDPDLRIKQAEAALAKLQDSLSHDPENEVRKRELLRLQRMHKALLEYQQNLRSSKAVSVKVAPGGDPGNMLDKYSSDASEDLPSDLWDLPKYGFKAEAFEDSGMFAALGTYSKVSKPATSFYVSILQITSAIKFQSMGIKYVASHFEDKVAELVESEPGIIEEVESLKEITRDQKSSPLPSDKLRDLITTQRALNLANNWVKEAFLKMVLIYRSHCLKVAWLMWWTRPSLRMSVSCIAQGSD